MKKVLLVFSAVLLAFALSAQNADKALAQVHKAKVKTENVKRATKVKTWTTLAEKYVDLYEAEHYGIAPGFTRIQTKLILKDFKIVKTEELQIQGQTYTKDTYKDIIVYYGSDGNVKEVDIIKPLMENPLARAVDALNKAIEVDKSAKKLDDIKESMSSIRKKYVNVALGYNEMVKMKEACDAFENALSTTYNPALNIIDTTIIYYTALTARLSSQNEKALKYYKECEKYNYSADGAVYSSLAEIYLEQKDTLNAKQTLLDGYKSFPTNQGILVNLINFYMSTNGDTNEILSLIQKAQVNEPTNASLHYAEGNVYKKLGDFDLAVKCYEKSVEVDPNYLFGIYSLGSLYYDRSIDIQNKISELDLNDVEMYETLNKEFEQNLRNAIDPYEKAFAKAEELQNEDFEIAIADALKQIYFRFREEKPEFMENFKKYKAFLEAHPQN
ncbi:MAG: tetratricopeptide repeat protein [Bacteroidales bacterium]